mmetsp:Transcript_20064/g.34529  ORF Transcript_20064/g.34529 Transcript_20064/m.34529 type:complete len:272 (+) Transcript_20064:251-1066(+)
MVPYSLLLRVGFFLSFSSSIRLHQNLIQTHLLLRRVGPIRRRTKPYRTHRVFLLVIKPHGIRKPLAKIHRPRRPFGPQSLTLQRQTQILHGATHRGVILPPHPRWIFHRGLVLVAIVGFDARDHEPSRHGHPSIKFLGSRGLSLLGRDRFGIVPADSFDGLPSEEVKPPRFRAFVIRRVNGRLDGAFEGSFPVRGQIGFEVVDGPSREDVSLYFSEAGLRPRVETAAGTAIIVAFRPDRKMGGCQMCVGCWGESQSMLKEERRCASNSNEK